MSNESFYSTYEELKPNNLKSIYCTSYSFYSTYEELKHDYICF